MAKFTPGPWRIGERWPDDIYAGEKMVCAVYNRYEEDHSTPKPDDCEEAANAHLVAAAPELLEQLEHICGEAESWHSMHHAQNLIACDSICKAIPGMKAAIRKARGESR